MAYAAKSLGESVIVVDWYVKRNGEDSPYPYSIRLGGCEYSLTEEEFQELHSAFDRVWEADCPYCVESEAYQDLIIASGTDKPSLLDILKIAKPVINRRGM